MNMDKTPVVMISFNRPDLVRLTMRNVSLAETVADRDIFMFIDGPRNDADKCKQDEIEGIVKSYQAKLPRLKIIRRMQNFGCRGNIVDAISTVINRYGRAIIVEDDVLVSRTFLRYMDQALELYEDDKKIWCINAYRSPYSRTFKDRDCDVYLNPMNLCWGWGTWKDRWNVVDFDLVDWQRNKNDEALLSRLNKAGSSLVSMLNAQVEGKLKTWDVQCTYYVVKNDLRCVEPVYSLVKNIGFAGGGEHFSNDIPILSRQKYYNFLPRLQKSVSEDARLLKQWEFLNSRNFWARVWRKCRRGIAWLQTRHMEPIDIRG